jgi:hypothetical protein
VVSVSSEVNRPSLNLRVDSSIKNAYEEEIRHVYGRTTPYAGIELERELRYYLQRGSLNELHEAVDELAEALAISIEGEKNNSARKRYREETNVVGYHIHDSIRERIQTNAEGYRSPGELVEAIMLNYIQNGSATQRLTSRIQRITEEVASKGSSNEELSAKQRRTKSIAEALDDAEAFKLEDFRDAISTAQGISPSEYVIKEYLPRVLDEMNFTWHPDVPELFISKAVDCYEIPEHRDPRQKPESLMTEQDERLAIKLDAFEEATVGDMAYTVNEARQMLNSSRSKSGIDQLMREIADESPGYSYSPSREKLIARPKKIKQNHEDNAEVIETHNCVATS